MFNLFFINLGNFSSFFNDQRIQHLQVTCNVESYGRDTLQDFLKLPRAYSHSWKKTVAKLNTFMAL